MTDTRPSSRRGRLSVVVVGITAALAGLVLLGTAVLPQVAGMNPAGPQVAREMPVTAMHRSVGLANNSPKILADPADPEFLVLANRLDAPDFSCALHVSGDAGRRWTPVEPVPELPEGAEKCYAPETAFAADGTLYYLFVGLAGRGNEPMGAFLTTSTDRGRTFSEPRQVLGPLNFAVRMAIDPDVGEAGRLHLVWIKATSDPPLGGFGPPPNPILAAYSDDGGQTFSEPVQVNDPERERVVAPALALGPDDTVHVAYYDLGDDAVDYQGLEGPVWEGTWSVVLATSTDGGQSFGEASVVDGEIVPPERVLLIFTMTPPALAVRDEQVCAAWADARHGDPDVLARCSRDVGQSWTEVQRVNDDEVGNGLSQFMPQLSFSPDGRLDAVFHDRRRHPENLLNHVYLSYSPDGGSTWAPNVRLTRHASSSLVGQRYTNASAQGRAEFGSRLGLLSRDGEALAAWGDTRNSSPDGTGQDIFTTVVELPDPGGLLPAGAMAGVGLVAAGAVALAVGWRSRQPGRRHEGEPT